MPLKLLILANCQGTALETICRQVTGDDGAPCFTILEAEPTHTWTLDYQRYIDEKLAECDVLLYQPHATQDSSRAWTGSDYWVENARHAKYKLSFQSLYFSAYNPELCYIRNNIGMQLNAGFVDYHDKRIVKLYLENKDSQVIKDTYQQIQPRASEVLAALDATLAESRRREVEQALDIKVADFIEAHFRHERLFFTYNHPANAVLLEVVRQLTHLVGEPEATIAPLEQELLKFDVFPIQTSVSEALKLEFKNDTNRYIVQSELYEPATLVERYLAIYQDNTQWLESSANVAKLKEELWLNRKTIYLHIGQSKTGTTSFQTEVLRQRASLLSKGILYPENGLQYDSHMDFARHYLLNQQDEQLIQSLKAEIDGSAANKVIISCESLEGLDREQISRLHQDFREYDLYVICMLRDRVTWITSMYCEFVKKAAYLSEFRYLLKGPRSWKGRLRMQASRLLLGKRVYQYALHCHRLLSDQETIGNWLDVFGQPHLLIGGSSKRELWEILESRLGIDYAAVGIDPDARSNKRPELLSVELAKRYYHENQVSDVAYPMAMHYLINLDGEFAELADTCPLDTPFSSLDDLQAFIARYQADDEWLAANFGFRRSKAEYQYTTFYNKKRMDHFYREHAARVKQCFSADIRVNAPFVRQQIATAYLHIGTEKTGSTAIQQLLSTNRQVLKKNGCLFPHSPGEKNHLGLAAFAIATGADSFQGQLLSLLGLDSVEKHQAWKVSFAAGLNNELSQFDGDSLVFSSEHLLSRLQQLEEVATLKNLLSKYVTDFRIIVYVRRQDFLAAGLYNEALKAGAVPATPLSPVEDYLENPFFRLYDKLSLWAEVFGDDTIDLRIFSENRFKKSDLLADFSAAIDQESLDQRQESEKENPSLTGDTQAMLKLVNATANLSPHPVFQAIRLFLIKNQDESSIFPAYKPDRCWAEALVKLFAAENKKMFDRWGRGHYFSNDFSMYDEALPEATDETLVYPLLAEKLDSFMAQYVASADSNQDLASDYAAIARIFAGRSQEYEAYFKSRPDAEKP